MKNPTSILRILTLALFAMLILGMGIRSDREKHRSIKQQSHQKEKHTSIESDQNYHIQLGSLPY